MPEISMKNMLEAGVHFGHQTHRWNPKMKSFIFGPRNGIYIIDLEKTVRYSKDACVFVKNTVAEGGKVLFVATKKQAKDVAKEAAARAGMPFVTERWLGGTLTNFATIRRGCERLDELDRWRVDGTYAALPKKETVRLERKRKKLDLSLGGVRHMRGLPAALFVVDPESEHIAVAEANRLGVPVVAVVDTNCDPDPIDYVIPGNDDALKSVTLFVNLVADACLEGAALFEQRMRAHQAPAAAASSSEGPVAATPVAATPAPAKAPAGPVVERVMRKQLKNIPTEIDYREETEDETATAEANAEATGEATGETTDVAEAKPEGGADE
ncbi:MAG: 30S ribosomal protein S2 [Deltaproteobacteria bacterium]|nr:30S ribosomal protein S2 [Deltaproteobacteria bacterium]